ncbi:tetratricopeptide repeat protein [Entomospira entomophila]|uniref:Tetratricopeptide repeat protein n=1 Tax=Entomospira entomophila TaxID=2719988 RepID=A0A968G935_9SPIO|nr:tetratricopeptide repeat protein [Entomospira entomophilus]NIZ40812.1 tetratricopeptide repeat protein [Entomospira entomophilus]WDI35024.1 tetratricopeptide repeat protein [Entomospira entomophilus]
MRTNLVHLTRNLLGLLLFSITTLTSFAQNVSNTHPAIALYDAGIIAMEQQEFFEAITLFRRALNENPNYAQARLKISEVYFFLGEYHEAITNLNLYDQLANDIHARTLRARAHTGLGQSQQARIIFQEVLEQEPNNVDARFGLAEVNLLEGRSDHAIAMIEQMLKERPQNRRALLSLTLIFDDLGQFQRSAPYMKQAIFYFPQDPLVRFHAGLHYEKQRMWREALQEYNAVYRINPNFRGLAQRRSQALMGLTQYTEAVNVLEELIKGRGREDTSVWALLAEALERKGDLHKAFQAYIELMTLQPSHELHRLTAEDFVLRNFAIGTKERETFASQRLEQARQLYRNLDNTRALQSYRRALILNPHHAMARYEMGRLLAQQGFPLSFIDQLRLLKQENLATEEMLTVLAREERRNHPNPAQSFGLAHMPIGRTMHILVTRIQGQSSMQHYGVENLLQQVFTDKMRFNTRFTVVDAGASQNESEAWHTAYNKNMDYSVVLRFIERDRRLFAQADLYIVSTGTLIQSFSVTRTGNTRVEDASNALLTMIDATIPIRAQIIRREGNRALISIGSLHGVVKGDEFIVVSKGNSRLISGIPYFEIINNSALGRLVVDDIGEFSSAGIVSAISRPDVITMEDEVFLIRDSQILPESSSPILGIPEGFFLLH